MTPETQTPLLYARGLVKRYGRVTALDHADFEKRPLNRPRPEYDPSLAALAPALDEVWRRTAARPPRLAFYVAGADPHEGDRLGRLKLTWDGLEARDRRVFDWAWARGLPLAFAMAGGYGARIEDTVKAQVNTFKVAAQYAARWQNRSR